MIDDLTKAPVPLKINDRTFEVSPLTQGDLGSLLRALEWRPFNDLRELPDVPATVLDKVMLDCAQRKIVPGTTEFGEALASPFAQTEVAYLSLKHKHPTIKRTEVEALPIADVRTINDIVLLLLNPYDDESKKKLTEYRETNA